jgi:uncharacterized membrane protein YeaQ/YmgE (transglycosylase-associated protein family)
MPLHSLRQFMIFPAKTLVQGRDRMLGFLIAAAAGFLTPQIEGPVAAPIVKTLEGYFEVRTAEKRLIAFMVALLGAAIIAAAFDSGSVFGIIIGAILGYFGTRIFNVLKKVIEGRQDAG